MTSHTNSPHLLHEVWGTVVTITIGSSVEPHSHQSPQFDPVLAACRDFMDRIDTIFSPFRPESLVTGYQVVPFVNRSFALITPIMPC